MNGPAHQTFLGPIIAIIAVLGGVIFVIVPYGGHLSWHERPRVAFAATNRAADPQVAGWYP